MWQRYPSQKEFVVQWPGIKPMIGEPRYPPKTMPYLIVSLRPMGKGTKPFLVTSDAGSPCPVCGSQTDSFNKVGLRGSPLKKNQCGTTSGLRSGSTQSRRAASLHSV